MACRVYLCCFDGSINSNAEKSISTTFVLFRSFIWPRAVTIFTHYTKGRWKITIKKSKKNIVANVGLIDDGVECALGRKTISNKHVYKNIIEERKSRANHTKKYHFTNGELREMCSVHTCSNWKGIYAIASTPRKSLSHLHLIFYFGVKNFVFLSQSNFNKFNFAHSHILSLISGDFFPFFLWPTPLCCSSARPDIHFSTLSLSSQSLKKSKLILAINIKFMAKMFIYMF